jgi:hypothetical protein
MSHFEFLLNGTVFQFPNLALRQVCTEFATKSLPSQYSVRSKVSSDVFKLFLSALKGESIEVKKVNFKEFSALCNEFGFELKSPSYRLLQVEIAIEELTVKIERLSDEVSALRGIPAVMAELSKSVTEFRSEFWTLPLSTIISDFPDIFTEFRGKRFSLLWRGSRDGFKASEFHGRCDGHSNTLTIILDTERNIFGGFTPVKWESRGFWKADESQKSFVFTLKNPHNIPAKKFALKAEEKHQAIFCNSGWCPYFYDIVVSDNCNVNTISCSYLSLVYINDTGLDGEIVFTGSKNFQVKEIEVFEITD